MNKPFKVGIGCAVNAAVPAYAGAFHTGGLTIGGLGTLNMAKANAEQLRFVHYNQFEGTSDDARIAPDFTPSPQASYQLRPTPTPLTLCER
ncbi:MAG: hypothetical protein V4754_05325 [Pseudomonadota bacterium]